MTERITSPDGSLDSLIIRAQADPNSRTEFFGKASDQLQVGRVVRRAGDSIRPHQHNPATRTSRHTAEVLVVVSGAVEVDLHERLVAEPYASRMLTKGDVLVLLQGGHGFEFAEDTEILEIKQGPFLGDDKVML